MKRLIVRFTTAFTVLTALSIILTCLNTPAAFAQPNEFKVTANNGAINDRFGHAVDISDDYAIVGAHLDDETHLNGGAAYIFKRDNHNWLQQVKLISDDLEDEDRFGSAVAISSDFAVVGAPFDDDAGESSGAAYVFKRNSAGSGWTQQQKLMAADPTAEDQFGASVAIDDDRIIIGAKLDDNDAGVNAGAAYVFWHDADANGWTQEAKLIANGNGTQKDHFGVSVDIDGEFAIIGAHGDWVRGPAHWLNQGSAYIFRRMGTTWSQHSKLAASDAPASHFGFSTSISGKHAIVGAYMDDEGGVNSGSAYLFDYSEMNWGEISEIAPFDLDDSDNFGISVDANDDYIIIGAHQYDDAEISTGAVFLYKNTHSGWFQAARFIASDAASGDHYGYAVAVSKNAAIVGARRDDDGASDAGSAYFYDLTSINCDDLSLPDTAAYGNIAGGDQTHGDRISYCFTGQPGDLALSFQAYAIDDNDEVEVVLNGSKVFDIPATQNSSWTETIRVFLPDSLVNDTFVNVLVFDHGGNSGEWGIRHAAVGACLPLPARTALGNVPDGDQNHADKIALCFPAQPGDVTLHYETYDVDQLDEVELSLNGVTLMALPVTGNNQWSDRLSVTLPDSLVSDVGANVLVFDNRYNPPKTWAWGVRNVFVTGCLSLPSSLAWGRIRHGDQDHLKEVCYTFDGRPGDVNFSYQVYDIDREQEVEVWLNDTLIHHVRISPNLDWSDTRALLLADELVRDRGSNHLRFRNIYNHDRGREYYWGVRQAEIVAALSFPMTAEIGSRSGHHDKAVFAFSGYAGDLQLHFEAFDVDQEYELDVLLNGTKIHGVAVTTNDSWSERRTVLLPAALIRQNQVNTLIIDNTKNPPKSWQWGVRNLSLDSTANAAEPTTLKNTSDEAVALPTHFSLAQNYPNPFNPTTVIYFALPTTADVNLAVFDINGRLVRTLITAHLPAGYHNLLFDGSGLAAGIYLYRMQASSFVETRKMLLAR